MLKIKTFVFSVVLFFIIITLLFCNYLCVSKRCNELIALLNNLEESIIKFDDLKISDNLKNVENTWNKEKSSLLAFSNHKNLDVISEIFLRISAKTDTDRLAEAIEEIRLAKLYIDDIRKNEIPYFENIF